MAAEFAVLDQLPTIAFCVTIRAAKVMDRMLSHVHVGITDYRRAFAFYSGIMNELGLKLRFQDPDRGWAAWMRGGVARPSSIAPAEVGYGFHGV